jgi:hypothetical protein
VRGLGFDRPYNDLTSIACRTGPNSVEGITLSKIDRAISIRQPYVELILRGEKREEYRSRPTNIRGRVYLYAAMKPGDRKFWIQVRKEPGELPTKRIVGSVEIVDCRPTKHGYTYFLANPRRLRTHLHPQNQPQPCFWRP